MIADPLHDEVDELTDLLRFLVEAGRRRKDDGTRLRRRGHVAEMDERERRLTRDEDELASLFERHVRGPLDQRSAGAVRNRGECAHGTRAYDHPERLHRPRSRLGATIAVVEAADARPVAARRLL